jgi:hypothetical protein
LPKIIVVSVVGALVVMACTCITIILRSLVSNHNHPSITAESEETIMLIFSASQESRAALSKAPVLAETYSFLEPRKRTTAVNYNSKTMMNARLTFFKTIIYDHDHFSLFEDNAGGIHGLLRSSSSSRPSTACGGTPL